MTVVRQGEVCGYRVGDRTIRIVVVSGDAFNQRSAIVLVAPVVRRRAVPEMWPYMVPLAEADNVSGAIEMAELVAVDRAGFAEPVTMLIGATMEQVRASARVMLEL